MVVACAGLAAWAVVVVVGIVLGTAFGAAAKRGEELNAAWTDRRPARSAISAQRHTREDDRLRPTHRLELVASRCELCGVER
jgi:hypothetical protein